MRDRDFERLYAEHAGALLAFLTYRTGDADLADDLLSDTFERALRGRRRFDPRKASEKTWLYSIAMNLLRDHGRRSAAGERAAARSQPGPVGPVGTDFELVETRDALARAMATLSPDERELVALRYGADLTLREISKLTAQPASTTAAKLYRTLEKLHGALAG